MASSLKKLARIFLSVGTIQYVVVTAIAMFFYPGGSNADPSGGPYTVGYDFFGNYFSDLGRTIAINGAANPIASLLYYIANVVYGASLIPFFLTIAPEFSIKKQGKGAGLATAIFGTIAGLGTLLYALAPSDTMGDLHGIGVALGYFGSFLAMLFLGIASMKSGEELKREGLILIISAIVFLISLLIGGLWGTVFMTMFMQKFGKYLTMLVFAIEGMKWLKRLK